VEVHLNSKGKKAFRLFAAMLMAMVFILPTGVSAELKEQQRCVDYLALGDSLAAGVLYDNTLGKGYADYIEETFTAEGFNVDFNKSFAVPGYTSGQVLADIQDIGKGVQQEIVSADVITIDAGANDLLKLIERGPEGISIDPVKVQAALQEVGRNIGATIGAIRQLNPSSEVYVMGYYNPFPHHPQDMQVQLNPALDGLNAAIEQASVQTGGVFVPVEAAMMENVEIKVPNPQNVHPSEAGYRALAGEFLKAIVPGKEGLGKSTARLYGMDRYETAIEISKEGWEKADTVLIARGDVYADALVATPLAYKLDAPILLTESSSLSETVVEEIVRLGAGNAVILGGKAAVSENVEEQLKDLELDVTRIGGETRFDTAGRVSLKLDYTGTAVIAYGYQFPDALSIAPYAAQHGYPILLTDTNDVPQSTLEALQGIAKTFVVGGTAVISDDVFDHFKNGERLSGETRYDTAAEIFRKFQSKTDKAVVATGQDFADALTGSVYAANQEVPLLLVKKDELPQQTKGLLVENQLNHFTVLGGKGSIDEAVIDGFIN
jgi:putative cell wall-binding protein/lysophospholipase L1-like esterase